MKIKTLYLLVLFICFAGNVYSQNPCAPPEIIFNKDAYNIFNDEQEMYLGEVIAETLEKDFRVINDREANEYLQKVGNKLVKHLPPTNLKFTFHIIDTPQLNAFATAGGRIYVTRKMVAFLTSEDELAGILGHELGHAIVRHVSTDISKLFREILEVKSVGDREDIFKKYNELIDNRNTKKVKLDRNHQNKKQLEADQVGVFAMIAAGYDPEGFATAWDRLTEIEGKTGSGIGDFFGTTKPEEKRLREILNAIKSIPGECLDKNRVGTNGEFQEWQSYIVTTSEFSKEEVISSVISKNTLDPFLRGDIIHFKFSPDGKYVIAQDSSGINVLKREPFSFVFRISARDAKFANFTPDSQNVTFQTYGLRVEKWNIERQKPTLAREVYVRNGCWQSALSPDGKTLVCFSRRGNLDFIDVLTNERIHREEKFYVPNIIDFFNWIYEINENGEREIDDIQMEFSPNGKYFLGGRVFRFRTDPRSFFRMNFDQSNHFAFDLEKREEIDVDGKIKYLAKVPFTFYSDDKIIGQDRENPDKSGVFSFPDGKRIDKFLMRADSFSKPYKNELILVRPTTTNPVGVYDIKSNQFIASNKTPALDLYENYMISESREGYIGLFKIEDGYKKLSEIGYLTMPKNNLGDVRNISVSEDLNWLAISEKSRGGVWNLKTGKMKVYARGFRGSHFDDAGNVYADFIGLSEDPRAIGLMNTKDGSATKIALIDTRNTKQYGKFIVRLNSEKEDKKAAKKEEKDKKNKTGYKDAEEDRSTPTFTFNHGRLTDIDFSTSGIEEGILEVYDTQTRRMKWSREFEDGVPKYTVDPNSETITYYWSVKSKEAKRAINDDPVLRQRARDLKDKDGDYLVQVFDANTGGLIGHTLIETGEGSFRIRSASADRKWISITDTQNRVQLYSLADGERRWSFFGSKIAINPQKPLAVVENIAGQLSVYSLETGKKLERLLFPSAVIHSRFSRKGEKIFVLTANQKYYLFDTEGFSKPKLAE